MYAKRSDLMTFDGSDLACRRGSLRKPWVCLHAAAPFYSKSTADCIVIGVELHVFACSNLDHAPPHVYLMFPELFTSTHGANKLKKKPCKCKLGYSIRELRLQRRAVLRHAALAQDHKVPVALRLSLIPVQGQPDRSGPGCRVQILCWMMPELSANTCSRTQCATSPPKRHTHQEHIFADGVVSSAWARATGSSVASGSCSEGTGATSVAQARA